MSETIKTVYLASTTVEPRLPIDSSWLIDADTLGQRIFSLGVPEKDLGRIFVKTGKGEEDLNLFNLSVRIGVTTQPFLLYSGMIGSGKTMAIKNFHQKILETPSTCKFDHPDPNFNLRKRVIPYISFRSADLEDIKDERDTRKRIIKVLINSLDIALDNSGFRDIIDWEIKHYWNHMFSAIDKNRFESEVFSYLVRQLGSERNDIETRYRVWQEIRKTSGIRYLSYLTELYGYLRNLICRDDLLFVFLIIDSIDQGSRVAQQFFAEKVRLFADEPEKDPMIIIALRPETALAKNERRGTSLIDFVSHAPPSSTEVLVRRINYALEEKIIKRYYEIDKRKGDIVKKIEAINEYLETLEKLLNRDTLITRFIIGASNGSARLALWVSQGILFQNSTDILSGNKNQQEIVRACITRGKQHYKFEDVNSHPIRNLFGVVGNDDIHALLIKSRILKFLIASSRNRKDTYLGDIVDFMCDIDYPKDLQLAAINELIEKPFPLVISLGTDKYRDYDELFQGANDKIDVTELGKGYIQNLLTEMYYIQEVMFDTYVDSDRFRGKYSDIHIWDRFNLLYMFLSGLIKLDIEEMETLSYSSSGDCEKMSSYIGKPQMISYEIIDRVAGVMKGIVERALKSKKISDKSRNLWQETITNYEGLRNWAWQNNSLFFKTD